MSTEAFNAPEIARRIGAAVDAARVMRRIEALAAIGGLPNGGVDRPAFSDAERAATDLFAEWMGAAGLTVTYDAFGNLFGSTDGNAPDTVVSAAGSQGGTAAIAPSASQRRPISACWPVVSRSGRCGKSIATCRGVGVGSLVRRSLPLPLRAMVAERVGLSNENAELDAGTRTCMA
jgi:hypothetical protein